MNNARPIRRALISVSDKTGIVEFAQALANRGVDILSTGGTARLLAEKGISVTEVSDYTGFPEMMDGRVKTLHPKVHGGVLGRRGQDDDVMETHGINPIDMVVVNLYPFAESPAHIRRPGNRRSPFRACYFHSRSSYGCRESSEVRGAPGVPDLGVPSHSARAGF